jgi:hypothetical protein
VLAFAFTEGTGVDWMNVAVIDDYDAPATVGTLAFAVFLAAMTSGRWFGPRLLDRYGRVPVVRVLALCGLLGVALFVFGRHPAVAFAGVLFWGVGASLGFRWDERRLGRSGLCTGAGQCGCVNRVLRIPERPAVDRFPRRPRDRPDGIAHRGRVAHRGNSGGRRRPAAAAMNEPRPRPWVRGPDRGRPGPGGQPARLGGHRRDNDCWGERQR